MLRSNFLTDATLLNEVSKQLGPFAAKLISSRKRTVATNYNQAVNTDRKQVRARCEPPGVFPKFGAARSPNRRAALGKDATN